MATPTPNSQPTQRNKRARPSVLPPPSSDLSSVLGMPKVFVWSFFSYFTIMFDSCFKISLGTWKSPGESPSAFTYCDAQRGQEFYSSPKFNSASKSNPHGFSGNSNLAVISGNTTFWSNRVDAATDSFSMNKESVERRQNTGSGCRLFGIQLVDNSNIEDTSTAIGATGTFGDTQPVPSLDAESEHSEPSNVNRADHPSVSCDGEKSSLRSPQESQSRQIRSCTKVVLDFFTNFFFVCFVFP